jgi:hypothetical protein
LGGILQEENEMTPEQAQFRLDHKLLCMERANERGDYHDANIFCAQAAYYSRIVYGIEETPENRNEIQTGPK